MLIEKQKGSCPAASSNTILLIPTDVYVNIYMGWATKDIVLKKESIEGICLKITVYLTHQE